VKKFILSCCVILTLTGLAKLYSATGNAEILDRPDPLLRMSNSTVLLAAGAFELAVTTYLLISESGIGRCLCIFWVALNFILYRLGTFWLDPGKPCPCIGTLADKLEGLGLKPQTIDWWLKGIIVYMLSGSLFFMVREYRHQRFKNSRQLNRLAVEQK
jgi:hypothetical protein